MDGRQRKMIHTARFVIAPAEPSRRTSENREARLVAQVHVAERPPLGLVALNYTPVRKLIASPNLAGLKKRRKLFHGFILGFRTDGV